MGPRPLLGMLPQGMSFFGHMTRAVKASPATAPRVVSRYSRVPSVRVTPDVLDADTSSRGLCRPVP